MVCKETKAAVLAAMTEVAREAKKQGGDPWRAIERAFPGTPADVVAEAWRNVADSQTGSLPVNRGPTKPRHVAQDACPARGKAVSLDSSRPSPRLPIAALAKRHGAEVFTMPSENFDHESSEHANLQVVPFHGDQIVTFENDGRRFVAMRRIVENLGLAWASQHAKLMEQKDKFNCHDIVTVGADGKERQMLAMPVEKLPLWLACVNPNKIKNDAVRAKVELYQAESAIALHDFWTRGIAVRDDLAGIVTGLDPSVSDTIGGIVKRVVAKQLREAMADFLPGMVRKELSVGRFGVVIGDMSVGEILERYAKVRGQRGLVTKASASLRHFCASKGVAPLTQRAGRAWCYVFPEGVAREWFETNGRSLVIEYQSAKAGQTVLPFPGGKKPR